MLPIIPPQVLKNLLCAHCGKYVSCGPVHVTPNSSVLCGRCHRYAKLEYRNLCYEAAAEIFLYPCKFWTKHCNKKLVWNETLEHEDICLFKNRCSVLCCRPGTFFKADRKLPDHTDAPLANLSTEVLQKLKCVYCSCYLSNKPVYLLPDGTSICHRCSHSNGLPNTAIPNLAYEVLANWLIFPCIYHTKGCTIRLRFGRELWQHEIECSYSFNTSTKFSKKTSKSKDGKERGVIQTHTGHIWGTITPYTAPYAPPNSKHSDGKMVTQEIQEMMKKKNQEHPKGFDAQSVDSEISRASTLESFRDNVSRDTADNISRSTLDNISKDSSIRPKDYWGSNEDIINESRSPFIRHPNQEIAPVPTPPGYNKISFNGYFHDNMTRYGRPSQLDPQQLVSQYSHIYHAGSSHLDYSASFNQNGPRLSQILPKKSESFRVGNPGIINELKARQRNSVQVKEENPYGKCNNLQELVQKHDEF